MRSPFVAILRGITPEEAVPVAEGLLRAGLRVIEVPMNSPRPLDSIRRLADRFGDDCLLGAVLYGDTEDGAWFFDLVQEKADVSALRDGLIFGESFADPAAVAALAQPVMPPLREAA